MMRVVVPLILLALILAGCAPAATGPAPRHAVGIGFETLIGDTDWARLVDRLEAADVDEVSLAVGRLDWLAYDPDGVGRPSGPVQDSGRDFVAEALDALEPWRTGGADRTITLTIDALIPGLIAEDARWAAVNDEGRTSEDFASVTALEGAIGDDFVTLSEELAERYAVDEVSVTELFIDESFGDDDRESFARHSGLDDWPRTEGGAIDTEDPRIGEWRSDVLATLVGRMAEASRSRDVPFAMDVRVNWTDPAAGRPESGHDYEALLENADRLTLWAYTGLADVEPEAVGELPGALAEAGLDVGRMIVSVGMWTRADEAVLSPDELSRALSAGESAGAGAVGVTPESLLEPSHWDVVVDRWG